jgi:hypothetical protein
MEFFISRIFFLNGMMEGGAAVASLIYPKAIPNFQKVNALGAGMNRIRTKDFEFKNLIFFSFLQLRGCSLVGICNSQFSSDFFSCC